MEPRSVIYMKVSEINNQVINYLNENRTENGRNKLTWVWRNEALARRSYGDRERWWWPVIAEEREGCRGGEYGRVGVAVGNGLIVWS